MAGPRIGSLCTGYGGLDDAVQTAFGGEVIWHADSDPGAAAILAHHTPSVPNLDNITQVDWSQVLARHGQIDILGMGFPCQDVSVAGLRAGLLTGNRSGLWHHCARAIAVLQPSLVVIENVPGLLSTTADRGLGSDAPDLDPSTGSRLVLRALGAVLGDLAGLGFDAEWTSVAASDGGGCHKRRRVFVLAWPADSPSAGLEAWGEGRAARSLADAAHASGDGRNEGRTESAGQQGRSHVAVGGRAVAADAARVGLERGGQHGDGGLDLRTAIGQLAADSDGEPRGERGDAASGEASGGGASAVDCGCDRASWGKYAAAIHRWEQVIGRPAPCPVDERGRLAPVFVEWMMGLAEGRVTAVPGLTRAQMLRALGNGVMPQQGTAALRLLRSRMLNSRSALAA